LAVLLEVEHRGDARELLLSAGHPGQPLALADLGRQLGAVDLAEGRLVVEQVDVRRPAGHDQPDHPLGLGREVERAEGGPDAGATSPEPH
jgi:hypothetical protein